MIRKVLPVLLLATACAGGANHEQLGDTAYSKALYAEALAEYRAASLSDPSARLWAKLGLSALHAQNFREATEAYRRLAQSAEPAEGVKQEFVETFPVIAGTEHRPADSSRVDERRAHARGILRRCRE